jgi:DNA-binding transcriptional regulator GbsR (MarR family)
MNNDAVLIFTEHTGRFYAKQYSFPPVVGRLLGYLFVCEPMEQSIGDIANALLTSRSAVTNAVNMLETMHLVNRIRPAGSRVALISIAGSDSWEKNGFDPAEYREQARLAREGLAILKNASPKRRQALEEAAALNDFLTVRMTSLLEEWHKYRDDILGKKNKKKRE